MPAGDRDALVDREPHRLVASRRASRNARDRRGGEVRRPRRPGRRPRRARPARGVSVVVRARSAGRSSRARGGRRARCGPRNRQTLIFAGARSITAAASYSARNSSGDRRSARTSAGWPSVGERRAHARRREPAAAAPASAPAPCAGARTPAGPAPAAAGSAPGARRSSTTSTLSTFGTGWKTVRDTRRSDAHVAGELREHRRHAVGDGPGPGREPLADLLLHHRDPARHAGQLLDRAQDRARGDAVGQVRDDLRRRRVERRRGRASIASARCSVRVRDTASSASRSAGLQRAVELDDVDVRAARGEVLADSTPRPPPISSTTSSGRQLGGALDDAEDVRVDQEVLAEVALGPHAELLQPRAGSAGSGRSLTIRTARRRSPSTARRAPRRRCRAPRRRSAPCGSTNAGWLRSLRTACGVRYGASVSTSSRSAGHAAPRRTRGRALLG